MSKIGKQPIAIPQGVEVSIDGLKVRVKGPKGLLEKEFDRRIEISVKDNILEVVDKKNDDISKALHGTTRAIIANMVKGVSEGWEKKLELVGTGYRAEVSGDSLMLTVGFSHPVKVEPPQDISFKVEKLVITVNGIDKEVVGQTAAKIRSIKPPEPYKGKGIKYVDEVIRRKAGKAAKTAGPA
jgi:large subunit ribosomal protein L6